MGPRLISRGGYNDNDEGAAAWIASRGPRLISRGGGDDAVEVKWKNELQWGRGSSAAEAGKGLLSRSSGSRLQWGRG